MRNLKISEIKGWFNDQLAYVRIDCLVNLLNECRGAELHYARNYIAHKEKDAASSSDYQELCTAVNDPTYWQRTPHQWAIHDALMRSTMATAIALLTNENRQCASAIYQRLYNVHIQFDSIADSSVANDVLLILTMARHHMAFEYGHREKLKKWYQHYQEALDRIVRGVKEDWSGSIANVVNTISAASTINDDEGFFINEQEAPVLRRSNSAPAIRLKRPRSRQERAKDERGTSPYVAATEPIMANVSTTTDCPTTANESIQPPASTVYPVRIELLPNRIFQPRNETDCQKYRFPIQVTLSNSFCFTTYKTYDDFVQMHGQLLERYQALAGCHGGRRLIPYFACASYNKVITEANFMSVWESRCRELSPYIYELSRCSAKITNTPCVIEFFNSSVHTNERSTLPSVDAPSSSEAVTPQNTTSAATAIASNQLHADLTIFTDNQQLQTPQSSRTEQSVHQLRPISQQSSQNSMNSLKQYRRHRRRISTPLYHIISENRLCSYIDKLVAFSDEEIWNLNPAQMQSLGMSDNDAARFDAALTEIRNQNFLLRPAQEQIYMPPLMPVQYPVETMYNNQFNYVMPVNQYRQAFSPPNQVNPGDNWRHPSPNYPGPSMMLMHTAVKADGICSCSACTEKNLLMIGRELDQQQVVNQSQAQDQLKIVAPPYLNGYQMPPQVPPGWSPNDSQAGTPAINRQTSSQGSDKILTTVNQRTILQAAPIITNELENLPRVLSQNVYDQYHDFPPL